MFLNKQSRFWMISEILLAAVLFGGLMSGPSSAQGMDGAREVLFISKPMHTMKIPGDTIAFIDFEHITPTLLSADRIFCTAQIESALAQHLADLNRFKVVTRDLINKVLEEQKITNSGSFKSPTKLGELIGADVLIYGKVQLCFSSRESGDPPVAGQTGAGQTGAGQTGGGQTGGGQTGGGQDAAQQVVSILKGMRGGGRSSGLPIAEVASSIAGAMKNKDSGADLEKSDEQGLRSLVMAQIQLIDADTGKQIFTTSLSNEYIVAQGDVDLEITHRELVARSADALANKFIDNFLARREARYLRLYTDSSWEFDRGVDLIDLGDCASAVGHFEDVHRRHQAAMTRGDLARLMYNQGIALMCSNRPKEAQDKLWASLRLADERVTFDAIEFANDLVDRGRCVEGERDVIIEDVRGTTLPPQADVSESPRWPWSSSSTLPSRTNAESFTCIP